jgi:DNA-binding MarR family transcriptional regulator
MAKKPAKRRALEGALEAAMRDVSGHGVLYSQAVASHLGMNSTDLECLDHVVQRGALAAGELANLTGLTTGAITGVVDRLERAGFARRTRVDGDRRKVLVDVVPGAIERIMPLYEPMRRAALKSLSRYRTAELELLLDFLERSRDAAVTAVVELRALTGPPRRSRGRRGRPAAS